MIEKPREVGVGEFGPIYEGVKGKEAIDFLLEKRSGEILSAFTRSDIGDIDLVWGKEGKKGYGLGHFADRVSALENLSEVIELGDLYPDRDNSVLIIKNVKGSGGTVIVRLDWKGNPKRWVVSSY